MSSMAYGNGGIPSNDDISIPSILPSSSGAIIQHPYLTPNPNAAYAAVAVAAAAVSSASPSSLGQYQHYYNPQLPPQQLLHVQQTSSFYPTTTTSSNHLQHHAEFSNSSSSAASSSSSIESSRNKTNRKRATDKTAKSNVKRKVPNNDEDDLDDDDDEENKYDLRGASLSNVIISNNNNNPNNSTIGEEDKEKQARENHCEIERRRRVKMATYFAELCDMVPSCSNLARKPDKLTILRMAAQFMKNLRTNNNSLTLNSAQLSQQQDLHKPSFLNDNELKYLMVESCDAFLFALNCDNLRVIYISDAIQQILSYTCHDWYSRFFYDFVHPDDVEKVREQLNLQPQDGSPNGNVNSRILDLKTGTVKKDGHSSASSKRSFICRLRVGPTNPLDHTHQNPFINPSILRRRHRTSLGPSIDGQLYEVVHVSGYIRNLNTHHHSSSHHDNTNHHPSSSNSNSQMAFIAIARIQNTCSPNVNDLTNGSISTYNSITTEFTCRCNWDTGEILFVDQRCTPIIGYKSHELLHKLIYEQIHPDDQIKFQDLYKRTVTQKNLLNTSTNLTNIIIRFRTNIDNEYVSLKTSTYAFCNPCTDDIEFIIVTFLSIQPTTTTSNNKTSVITNSNDYNRQTYDTYSRTTTTTNQNPSINYTSQSPSTYNNQDGQDYSTGNGNTDGRTFVSNNGGSTWASANDNWTATTTTTSENNSQVSSTPNSDYVDTQTNLALYHQYH
ncbi:unnamed protein product [Rotaria sp. Silwood2]|nr:unnamed protein product [Rotaria sp. Silwood2]CAF2509667.1 unnamed protein product [Rotaria sp. Silwood2]CAF3988779.1 unnamed protein product [Rotaria sp. Silwood2]CAF4010930.1 unnamed protein product [Rotaria sp. Silwood2]CAF4124665.1 unnamed protein product [Rotaria sp. Silwood2]